MNSRDPKVFVFLYREAENTIGTGKTQVYSVNEEVVGPKYAANSHLYCNGEMTENRGVGLLFKILNTFRGQLMVGLPSHLFKRPAI